MDNRRVLIMSGVAARWTPATLEVVPVPLRLLLRWVSIAVSLVIAAPAAPAFADPARPGNTVSVVDAVVPPVPGVRADIVGGDAFLRLTATPGTEVRIPGYLGEPYLRIEADGSVWRNAESPATTLNEDRYITGDTPDVITRPNAAASLAEPRWEPYGGGGTVLWHDHRVHWMGSGNPPTIDAEGLVQQWEVPVEVDGQEVLITGRLLRRPAASTGWWGAALVAAGFVALIVMRRRVVAAMAVIGVVAGFGVAVSWWAWASLPQPARSAPAMAVLASVAALCTAATYATRHQVVAGPLLAGAGTSLVLMAWLGRQGVTAAVVPGLDDPWPWRVAVTAALGAGLVALVSGAQTASRSRAPVSLEG